MELCIARPGSDLPSKYTILTRSHSFRLLSSSLQRIYPYPFNQSGLRYRTKFTLRSSISDDASTVASPYVKDELDGVITLEEPLPTEKLEYGENVQDKVQEEDAPGENQLPTFEFLDKLDLKLDSDDTYSILLLSGGSLVALYLATAIIGAINSVPLFPKLLEIVGLSYTLWFIMRYLLFKQNREELAAKIEELKQQILG